MATMTVARPELFNQVEVGIVLKLRPKTVGEIAPRLGFAWRRDPHRGGRPRYLSKEDVVEFGDKIGTPPDWSSLSA